MSNKLCPFRKSIMYMDNENGESFCVKNQNAYFTEEEFLPCLQDKCAAWAPKFHECGLIAHDPHIKITNL